MNRQEIRSWILQNCFNENGSLKSTSIGQLNWWKKNNRVDVLKHIDTGYSIIENVMLFLSGMTEHNCKNCGKRIDSLGKIFCSYKCSNSDKDLKSKRNKPDKYCHFKSQEFKDYMKSFDVYPSQREEVIQKRKKTNKEKYGTEYQISSPKTRKKIDTTLDEKYGVQNVQQIKEVKQRTLKTQKENLIKIHGVDNFGKTPEALRKNKESLDRKGIINHGQENFKKLAPVVFEILNNKELLINYLKEYEYHAALIRHFHSLYDYKVSITTLFNYMRKYDIPIVKKFSGLELELIEYIKTFYDNDVLHNKYKIIDKQLDVYVPDKQIAYEIDGLHWHSEDFGKSSSYHLNKTVDCESKGIQLFHIYDNEWITKKGIWKSVIKDSLGIHDVVIGARQTTLREITSKEARVFCQFNHLQGSTNTSFNYGLFYDNELVAVMTFSKARYGTYDYELQRFCCKLGYKIHGAASKLLKAFTDKHKGSLVSYANRRWSKGSLYEKLGFEFINNTEPSYFYFKHNEYELYSRIKFQKHKLKEILEHFDENLSEWENMKANGYDRIWDCGNKVYVLNI